MSGLRQRQTMSSNAGKAQRVADYIKSEVVMPDGQPSGSVLRRADKQLGGVILSISQAIWFLAIAIGILFYQGMFSSVQCCPLNEHGHADVLSVSIDMQLQVAFLTLCIE